MRVFMFKTGGLGDDYGVGTYIKSIIKASENHRLLVEYIVIDFSITAAIEKIKITKKKNITYCKIPATFNGINMYTDALFPNAIYATLCGLFNLQEDDIFHFNTGVQVLLAKKIKQELGATIVYTVHYWIWKTMYQNHAAFLKEFKNKTFKNKLQSIHQEKELCRISKKVISMNSEVFSYLKEDYGVDEKRIVTLPNGLPEYGENNIDETTDVIKEKLGLSGKKVILYLGRINYEKGVFDLIEVFKKIVASTTGVKLVIVGDGAISQALSLCNGIWNDVMFTGYIKDKKQIMEFYKIADIMVLVSHFEHCSFTFLEGIQNKKPLILSAIPAFEKLDEHSCRKVNFVKKRGADQVVINRKQLSNEIVSLLNDKNGADQLAENAFKIFQNEFNIDMIYNCLIHDVYNITGKPHQKQ